MRNRQQSSSDVRCASVLIYSINQLDLLIDFDVAVVFAVVSAVVVIAFICFFNLKFPRFLFLIDLSFRFIERFSKVRYEL